MAITFVNNSFNTAGSGTSNDPGAPASVSDNDVYVGLCLVSGGSSNLTRPTGWTNIVNGTVSAGTFDYDVSYIVKSGTPSTQWTWTTTNYNEAFIAAFRGVDTTAPLDAQASIFTTTSGARGTTRSASAIDCNAVTAATANCMAVAIATHWSGSDPSWQAPTGYTIVSGDSANATGNDGMIAYKLLGAAGSENPDEFFCSGSNDNNGIMAIVITLKEASSGTFRTARLPILGAGRGSFTA